MSLISFTFKVKHARSNIEREYERRDKLQVPNDVLIRPLIEAMARRCFRRETLLLSVLYGSEWCRTYRPLRDLAVASA